MAIIGLLQKLKIKHIAGKNYIIVIIKLSKNPNQNLYINLVKNIIMKIVKNKVINLLNTLDSEIKDLEELTELSKDNPSELEEIKPQFDEVEQKIIDLEEESLYSSEFDDHSAVLTVNV